MVEKKHVTRKGQTQETPAAEPQRLQETRHEAQKIESEGVPEERNVKQARAKRATKEPTEPAEAAPETATQSKPPTGRKAATKKKS
jgi:hypothetical protein